MKGKLEQNRGRHPVASRTTKLVDHGVVDAKGQNAVGNDTKDPWQLERQALKNVLAAQLGWPSYEVNVLKRRT